MEGRQGRSTWKTIKVGEVCQGGRPSRYRDHQGGSRWDVMMQRHNEEMEVSRVDVMGRGTIKSSGTIRESGTQQVSGQIERP